MEPRETDQILESFRREREELDHRIRELTERRKNLDLAISEISARAFVIAENVQVTQKNRRFIIISGLIRELLLNAHSEKKRGLKTRKLFGQLSERYGPVKYATFRGYLHRLKTEGRIYQRNKSSPWHLSESWKKEGGAEMN